MNTNIIGVYEEEATMIAALKKIREENIEINDVFSPYPIHEVFEILKRKTKISYATFVYTAGGFIITYAFLYWTSVISYPLIYGGKPLHSIPSFIVISFVTAILLGVVASAITFFIRSKLYPGKKANIVDPRITDNAFVILIDKKPEMSQGDIKSINSLLKENGAIEVIEK